MKKLMLVACAFAALFLGGWTWDAAANNGHHHKKPSASISVTADTTTVRASGCPASEYATIHVEYDNRLGESMFNVDGYTTAGADGTVNATFGIGSAIFADYAGAYTRVSCGGLTLEART